MTKNRKQKHAVRKQAERTGMSYAATLNATMKEHEEQTSCSYEGPLNVESLADMFGQHESKDCIAWHIYMNAKSFVDIRKYCWDTIDPTNDAENISKGHKGRIWGASIWLDNSVADNRVIFTVSRRTVLPVPSTPDAEESTHRYVAPLSPTMLADLFGEAERKYRTVTYLYMNAFSYVDVRKFGRDILNIESDSSKLKQGVMSYIWGAEIRLDPDVPNHHVKIVSAPLVSADPKTPTEPFDQETTLETSAGS